MSVRKKKKIKKTRAQTNKNVRRILLRYKICLINLSFSTTSRTIFLKGYLLKNNGSDLPYNVVQNMVIDLTKHGSIRSDLENWVITNDTVSFLGGIYDDLDFDEAA